jgi:hypothetical protein
LDGPDRLRLARGDAAIAPPLAAIIAAPLPAIGTRLLCLRAALEAGRGCGLLGRRRLGRSGPACLATLATLAEIAVAVAALTRC